LLKYALHPVTTLLWRVNLMTQERWRERRI
jgi:hypothetical protein